MIVGNRRITDAEIIKHRDNMMVLAQQSVPSCCHRTVQLEYNQLFYLLSRLRNIKTLPFKVKQKTISMFAPEIDKISGTAESVYDIADVLLSADTNGIFKSIFGSVPTDLTEDELHAAIDLVLNRGR